MSTTASMFLLTPDRRLDILIELSNDAVARAKTVQTEEAWDAATSAWEALHDELMHQIDKPAKEAAI